MALKFDMGNASWARQMAAQQQGQMADTLGQDIGMAIGMGASAIYGKAKKKFGAKYAKALDKHKKSGSEKDFMSMDEFKKKDRQRKRDTRIQKRLTKTGERLGIEVPKNWKISRDKNNPETTGGSTLGAFLQTEGGQKLLKEERKERRGGFGEGVLGAALSPFGAVGGLAKGGADLLGMSKDKREERKNLRELNRSTRGTTDYSKRTDEEGASISNAQREQNIFMGRDPDDDGTGSALPSSASTGSTLPSSASYTYDPQTGEYIDEQGFSVTQDQAGYEAEKTKTPGLGGLMQRAIPGGSKGYDFEDPHQAYLDEQFTGGPLAQFINQQWQGNPFQPPSNNYGVNLNKPDPFIPTGAGTQGFHQQYYPHQGQQSYLRGGVQD
tara:strand:+ start:635 stop:1780 length:1146 start_codon:yes stop_codon:yes gene_type:complete